MTAITDKIIEDGIDINGETKYRETVRSIVINEHKQVGLLYSKKFKDFTFPGGGIKENETHITALQRELYEEIGATEIRVLDLLGYTEELKYGLWGNKQTYTQKSYYYFCEILSQGEPNFIEREIGQGLSFEFVDFDHAIEINLIAQKDKNHQQDGLRTTLKREQSVLNKLKEIYDEKI